MFDNSHINYDNRKKINIKVIVNRNLENKQNNRRITKKQAKQELSINRKMATKMSLHGYCILLFSG